MKLNTAHGKNNGKRTDNYARLYRRVTFHECLNNMQCLVVLVRNREDDFEVGVFLLERGFKVLI